ncbi:MAG: ABC transporter ATP-binding protein, partial [Oscillospiraceae bacterium]
KRQEKAVMDTAWKKFVWSNGFEDSIWALSKLAEFIIVYGVGALLIFGGYTDMSVLMTFIFANDLFTIGINNISRYLQSKSEYEAYKGAITGILGEEELEDEEEFDLSRVDKTIRFENVSFSYGDKVVLDGVNLRILPGEKVLIAGKNGEGKSTLLKLICGLYRPDSGKIYWGDKDIARVNIGSIAKNCNYISQESHMLAGSVSENIALAPKAEEGRLTEVLEKLNLQGTVHTSPQSLSLGERQRINIGRAIYRNRGGILLCDEIFSAVDQENRQAVIRALVTDFQESTVIMVTHTKIDYPFSRVLRVENGKVREEER